MKFPGEMSSASSLSTVINNDDATLMIHGLEFPKDDAELDADPSDSDGYLSEDPECPYYSDSEDEKAAEDCIMEDGLYRQNDDMNRDIKKQKKKLKKLLDKVAHPFIKRAGHPNFKYIHVLLTIAGCMLQDILLFVAAQ